MQECVKEEESQKSEDRSRKWGVFTIYGFTIYNLKMLVFKY